jgi:hypothetical protein
MKYIGNIGHLLESVYVREKLPKDRKKRTWGKKSTKKLVSEKKSEKNVLNVIDNSSDVKIKLMEIRKVLENETKSKGKHTDIVEGFVYLVSNPAFTGWIKAGMTTDFEKRLHTYNTADPFCNFKMLHVKWVKDRRQAEETVLRVLKFKAIENNGEWFRINESEATIILDSLVL